LKASGLFTGAAKKRNSFVGRNRSLPCNIRFFWLFASATSRVELTLNANLLPSKVASPQGEMRPIRQLNGN
jgi:hypothetical protein